MPLDRQKIRLLRLSQGLSQKTCAERAGMAQPHWARIEHATDDRVENLQTIERIAAALGVRASDLIG